MVPKSGRENAHAKHILWRSARTVGEECLWLATQDPPDLQRLARMPERFAREGDDVRDLLVEGLDHEHPRARVYAAFLLSSISANRPDLVDSALRARIDDTLRKGLSGTSVEECLWPCLLLSSGRVPPAVEPDLWMLVRSENELIRLFASAALSTIEGLDDAAGDEQSDLLDTRGLPAARQTVGPDAVGDRDYMAVVRNLEIGMRSSDPDIAGLAAVAMARLGVRSKQSVDSIKRALPRATPPVQFLLLSRLEQLGEAARPAVDAVRSVADDAACLPVVRGLAVKLLGAVSKDGKSAAPVLLRAIASEEPEVIAGAAQAFERLGFFPQEAIRALSLHLIHDSEPVRIAAAYALAEAGKEAAPAVPSLIARLGQEPNPEMCRALVKAFAAIGAEACPALIEVVKENDVLKLPIAGQAFVHMGYAGAEALVQALRTETDEWIRGLVVVVLRDMGPAAAPALPELTAMLEECEDEELAACLIMAIFCTGRAGLPQVPALVRCLLYGSDELTLYAIRTLKDIGAKAIPFLTEALQEAPGGHKQRLVDLLGELKPGDATKHAKFARIGNDSIIWTFVQVGDLLLKHEHMSIREISEVLKRDPQQELLGSVRSLSEASIRERLKKLSTAFDGVSLTTHAPRKRTGGLLTDDGKKLLIEAKRYLSWKAEWIGGAFDS